MSMWCLASQDPTAHQYTVHSSYLHSWVIFSIHFVPEHSPWLLQFIQMRKTDFKCVFTSFCVYHQPRLPSDYLSR